MRSASNLAAAVLVALCAAGLADAAAAQTPGQAPRSLSWPGRGEAAAAPLEAAAADRRRPNPVIPHGGQAAAAPRPALTPAPGPVRRTLTPANAWMRPAAAAPEPAPVMAPVMAAAAQPQPQPQPQPRAVPDYLPDQGGRGQPAPAEIVDAAPEPVRQPGPDAAFDPMAPRRDAPIFRLQQGGPAPTAEAPEPRPEAASSDDRPTQPRRIAEVTNTGEQPPRQGARYYSVHRQNGREPDALVMPVPTFVDALAVTMTDTPASQDLAQPDQGPTLIRNTDGRVRPAPAASDGDHL